jgi:hypothetical protein
MKPDIKILCRWLRDNPDIERRLAEDYHPFPGVYHTFEFGRAIMRVFFYTTLTTLGVRFFETEERYIGTQIAARNGLVGHFLP